MLSSEIDPAVLNEQLACAALALMEASEQDGPERVINADALQLVLTAAVRALASRHRAGDALEPFGTHDLLHAPTATDVAIVVTAMLESAGIEIFELGLWNSWGRPGGETGDNGD